MKPSPSNGAPHRQIAFQLHSPFKLYKVLNNSLTSFSGYTSSDISAAFICIQLLSMLILWLTLQIPSGLRCSILNKGKALLTPTTSTVHTQFNETALVSGLTLRAYTLSAGINFLQDVHFNWHLELNLSPTVRLKFQLLSALSFQPMPQFLSPYI